LTLGIVRCTFQNPSLTVRSSFENLDDKPIAPEEGNGNSAW
jgi:hypothetical protein